MLVEIDDANGVRTLTLNRPEALNAFNEALYDATTIALREADDDPTVAVVLLTGSGPRLQRGQRPRRDAGPHHRSGVPVRASTASPA